MEYRRRKKRKRSRNTRSGSTAYCAATRHSNSGGTSFLGLLLILLLSAGLIYILIATPVGTWLTQNIFSSNKTSDKTTPPPLTSAEPAEFPTDTALITETMSFPALDAYALQIGVYTQADTASSMIASLRSLGAAGYALETPEGVRILTSCYDTEAAAKSVYDRLREQGYECIVYPMHMDGAEMDVTCTEATLAKIRSATDYSHIIISELYEEVLNFDSEERSIEYGIAVGTEMLNNVKAVRNSLKGISDSDGLLTLLDAYYMNLESFLTSFIGSNSTNRVAFSGELKHVQIDAIANYMDFLNKVHGLN